MVCYISYIEFYGVSTVWLLHTGTDLAKRRVNNAFQVFEVKLNLLLYLLKRKYMIFFEK